MEATVSKDSATAGPGMNSMRTQRRLAKRYCSADATVVSPRSWLRIRKPQSTNMVRAPKILVVEDDDAIRALLVAALRREPFDVHSAVNGAEALVLVRAAEYAVILLDLMMPALNGVEFLQAFHEMAPESRTVVFVMTAFDDAMVRHVAPNLVHGIVRKPFDVPQLVAMVREVALTRMPDATASERDTNVDVLEAGDEVQPN